MRVFHVSGEQFVELDALPEALPAAGYLWIGAARREFEVNVAMLQGRLAQWTGSTLVDLHVSDLLNNQLPSHFDATSGYDLLVFRRLAAGAGRQRRHPARYRGQVVFAAEQQHHRKLEIGQRLGAQAEHLGVEAGRRVEIAGAHGVVVEDGDGHRKSFRGEADRSRPAQAGVAGSKAPSQATKSRALARVISWAIA